MLGPKTMASTGVFVGHLVQHVAQSRTQNLNLGLVLAPGPLFPFGFGLSYTNFEYSNLRIIPPKKEDSAIAFSVTVSNTGDAQGKEVVQCYVGVQNSSVERALKYLLGIRNFQVSNSNYPGNKHIYDISL